MNEIEIGKKFLRIVSNFDIKLIFHKEKYSEGRTWFDTSTEKFEWRNDPDQDYWDFDIEINGYKEKEVLNNPDKRDYEKYLQVYLDEFKEAYDVRNLRKYSKPDCYDLLINDLETLRSLKKRFRNWHTREEDPEEDVSHWTSHDDSHIDPSEPIKYSDDDHFIRQRLSKFYNFQSMIIGDAIGFLERKVEWINLTNDNIPNLEKLDQSEHHFINQKLIWCKSDTDLLELVTALTEMKVINNNSNTLTRKEAIDVFSKIFDRNIKDAESKLSRATDRKKDVSPFLSALKESFDNYAIKKEQK